MRKIPILLIPLITLSWFCTVAYAESGKIRVFVSILPQAYFVERVGGAYVDVEVLVGPGRSPATYEPTPKQIARLSRSRVYFRIGTPFEKGFMEKLARTHQDLNVIDIRNGVTLRYFKSEERRQVADPHTWLDPKRVKIMASTVCEGLIRAAPEHRTAFEENLKAFQADLDRVDSKISKTLAPLTGGKFYVFHPAFGYFGDSYGLTQVAVEIEGKEPTPKQLADLIERAKADKVKVVFVQPQFAGRNARTIAEAIGGAVVPMDPLSRDYLNNLEKMAGALKTALEGR